MTTHAELMVGLPSWGAINISDAPDRQNSVSGVIIRCSHNGRRTVAVGSDASTEQCIGAVLDLLDMHLHDGATYAGHMVESDQVAVVLGKRTSTEAIDAIGSLIAALSGGPSVEVLVAEGNDLPRVVTTMAADFSNSPRAAHYLDLMERLEVGPPDLLCKIVQRASRLELRAYPMLTANPWWSLRLEGLEVGRFRPDQGWLDVGKVGKTGLDGAARESWLKTVHSEAVKEVDDSDANVSLANTVLTAFAETWLGAPEAPPATRARQNEHALESRILRGACPVVASTGPLDLLAPDPVTNWGSQFPTRWGHTGGNAARYLDALMRDGRVPWAVEMKVQGSGGVGRYYRHAVGQAVLYRHFIRSASPLDPWFARHGLDRVQCRAAVVVPDLDAQPAWRTRLRTLCDLVDVELIEVPHEYARLR